MSKLDALKRSAGGNASESMARLPMHGASAGGGPAAPEPREGWAKATCGRFRW